MHNETDAQRWLRFTAPRSRCHGAQKVEFQVRGTTVMAALWRDGSAAIWRHNCGTLLEHFNQADTQVIVDAYFEHIEDDLKAHSTRQQRVYHPEMA